MFPSYDCMLLVYVIWVACSVSKVALLSNDHCRIKRENGETNFCQRVVTQCSGSIQKNDSVAGVVLHVA